MVTMQSRQHQVVPKLNTIKQKKQERIRNTTCFGQISKQFVLKIANVPIAGLYTYAQSHTHLLKIIENTSTSSHFLKYFSINCICKSTFGRYKQFVKWNEEKSILFNLYQTFAYRYTQTHTHTSALTHLHTSHYFGLDNN